MVSSSSDGSGPDLARHRFRIARVLLIGFAALGLFAYVPSVWLATRVGAWGIVAVDTVVYAALLAMLPLGYTRYRLQAGIAVGALYLLGVALSVLLGPGGGGLLWLMGTPVAAAILFERRTAVAILGGVTLTAVAIALLSFGDTLPWTPDPTPLTVLWIVLATNALLLSSGLTFAVTTLIRGLQHEMLERQRAESQLRQAEKMRAIGTLAAGIAHDFNNLLTPILSATEMARADTATGSPPNVALEQAINAALAGRLLVQRILAFSRPSAVGRMAMPAADAFRDAVRLLRAAIPGSIAVDLQVDPSAADSVISLSPGEVHQIVLNLGMNAQKAISGSGTLRFLLDSRPWHEGPWQEVGATPLQLVRLHVIDTGVGMPPEVASRIFEPFFTTDSDSGTGIGLATVHGIVTSAGGLISCQSQPGVGTTFTIELPDLQPHDGASRLERIAATPEDPPPVPSPVADQASTTTAPTPAEPSEEQESSGHILVVDDEDGVRKIAEHVLLRAGYRVTPATSAEAALELLRATPDGFTLILSDLHMPGETGLQLAGHARTAHPSVPFVLMSGLVDETLLAQAVEAGVDRVVAKPFRVRELLEAVGQAMEGASTKSA